MALSSRLLIRNCQFLRNITKPVHKNVENFPARIFPRGLRWGMHNFPKSTDVRHTCVLPETYCKQFSTVNQNQDTSKEDPPKKKGLVQQFKEMYQKYWYVVVPVHLATSTIWFGTAYYLVRSGVDVPAILQSLGLSEPLIRPLKESSAGYFALAFALYKLATPLRYAVTIGGTTYAIRRLTAMGWIKPVPTRERIKEIMKEKQDRFKESKQLYQSHIKEKRTQIMDDLKRYKTEMETTKNKSKQAKKRKDNENE